MNARYLFILFVALMQSAYVTPRVYGDQKPCRCYCSDLCGPRDATKVDSPYYHEGYGKCFCRQRDEDNYVPHRCHRVIQSEATTCCDNNGADSGSALADNA